VLGGRLQARFTYSENLHRRATIEGVAEAFLAALRELVEHCRSADARGLTPSDFQDVSLSQGDLDMLSDLAVED
jgi:non-ribosomal peptide synthase protein (TIGR01720 family)